MSDVNNAVSRTAYYCCGLRALDAASPSPVCGDQFAERCMTPEGWTILEHFRTFRNPNAANVVRHRVIDDLLRDRLAERPDTLVIVLGAGFDTRPFRLGGGRWVEVDEPAILVWKERCLPSGQAPQPLRRIPVAFQLESLEAALAPIGSPECAIVVIEGVLGYLPESQIHTLLQTIRRTVGRPTLICDFTTRAFTQRYSGPMHAQLRAIGASPVLKQREVRALIEEAGFRLTLSQSIVERAVALGSIRMPRWLLATAFRVLRDGYVVGIFDIAEA